MPISRKKLAAKKRLEYQVRNSDSGQFEEQFSDSEYGVMLKNLGDIWIFIEKELQEN
jgi:hypothetical protein